MDVRVKAEAALRRKYGQDAWYTVPNWAKVRDRLEQRMWDNRQKVTLWLIPLLIAPPTSVLSALTVTWLLR